MNVLYILLFKGTKKASREFQADFTNVCPVMYLFKKGKVVCCSEVGIHRGSTVSRGFQANLKPPEICVNLFFSAHFVEEKKTFSSRLEICFQMSTKMSENAPKVVHFTKNLLGGWGVAYAR